MTKGSRQTNIPKPKDHRHPLKCKHGGHRCRYVQLAKNDHIWVILFHVTCVSVCECQTRHPLLDGYQRSSIYITQISSPETRLCHVMTATLLKEFPGNWCQSVFPQKWLRVSLLINEVITEITVRNNKLKVEYHCISSHSISSICICGAVTRTMTTMTLRGVSLRSLYDSHNEAWIQNRKCLDKTLMHVHMV